VVAFTRRRVLSSLAASLGAVAAGASQLGAAGTATAADEMPGMDHDPAAAAAHSGHAGFARGGIVDSAANGFDPSLIVRDFDWGRTSKLADGRTLREWNLVASDKEIEIAPGVRYAAWTFNGRVPGPTLRCVDGDRLRIRFSNGSAHPHTVHFHGIHPSEMDGVPGLGENIGGGLIQPGQSFTYEFDAGPFGCHLYHCHSSPLKRHIHKGLYGGFIIDPDPKRGEAAVKRSPKGAKDAGIREMVMLMNAFDVDFDGENDVYAVNTIAFGYNSAPIRLGTDEIARLYLINVTEFDPLNSFHLHGNFFDVFPTGTGSSPTEHTAVIASSLSSVNVPASAASIIPASSETGMKAPESPPT